MGATLEQYKAAFRRAHPNLRVNGWDERDYQLWGQLQNLNSYGLVAGSGRNPMVALKDVIALLERSAEARFEAEWKSKSLTTAIRL
jgi:hypothetical protein